MNKNYNSFSIKLKLHWLKLFCEVKIFCVKSCLFRSQYILGNDENCPIVLVPKIVLCEQALRFYEHTIFFKVFAIISFSLYFLYLHNHQELVTYQQSCKKCLSVIDKNHQIILKSLDTSKNLKPLDTSLLERRISELQASSQVGTHRQVSYTTMFDVKIYD